MTMQEKHAEMVEAYEQISSLESYATNIASELVREVDQLVKDIDTDPIYTTQGKTVEKEKVIKKYGEKFIQDAKGLREAHDKAVVKAQVSAEILLNYDPPKPDDVSIKSFERQLSAMKMNVMLSANPNDAVREIEAFATKQTKPYFAKKLAGEFESLAANIIANSGNDPKVKLKLRSAVDHINSRAMTEEQKKAAQIASYVEGAFGRDLFRTNSIELGAIERVIGRKYSLYANKPQHFVKTE